MHAIDFDKYSEDIISKRNRRKRLEADKDQMVVDPLPPSGVHKEKRKDRDRSRNLIIKDVLKH